MLPHESLFVLYPLEPGDLTLAVNLEVLREGEVELGRYNPLSGR